MTLDHETVLLLCEVVDGRVAVFNGIAHHQPHTSTATWPFTDADYFRFAQLVVTNLAKLAPGPGGAGIEIDATGDGHIAVAQYRAAGGQW